MKVLKISKDEIKEYEKLKIISQLAMAKGKIELLEKKYRCSFNEFDKIIKRKKSEDFNAWDDYIEWKAYIKTIEELKQKIKEIEGAENITVT